MCVSEDISRDWLCQPVKQVEILWVTPPSWPRTWIKQKAKAGRILHHGQAQVFLSFRSFVAALISRHQTPGSKCRFLLATLQGDSKSTALAGPILLHWEFTPHPQLGNRAHCKWYHFPEIAKPIPQWHTSLTRPYLTLPQQFHQLGTKHSKVWGGTFLCKLPHSIPVNSRPHVPQWFLQTVLLCVLVWVH